MLSAPFLALLAEKLPDQTPWLTIMRELGSEYDVDVIINVTPRVGDRPLYKIRVDVEDLSLASHFGVDHSSLPKG